MRRVAVSLAVVMMVLASFATPTFAGKPSVAETDIYRITINTPDVAVVGQAITVSGTITLFNDGSGSRKPVYYEVSALHQNRAGVKAMQVGKTRTITRTYAVPAQLPAGTYTITFAVSVDGRNSLVEREITVRER